MKYLISWQYCKDLNEINEAIQNEDPNWDGLKSATQIININWNREHHCYEVFWRVPDNIEDRLWEAAEIDYVENHSGETHYEK